jgi:serine/threonine-protein kinase
VSESIPGTIGKYQIIREIARSNDIVYEAYDPRMNRRVAVKELAMPSGASGQQRQDRLKRFEREARAAGSLVHPNIVTIYEVGTDGDKNYIAMEFLTGRNLRKEIDKTGFIEPKHAVEVAIEVLEGLAFAHENGVIHRDIKPDNVQLLDDGQVKLTDFGIARLTFEPNITMDGQVFGTPSYMSPEQINGQEIDARSDLFGVGVILYEMVCGQKPFQGDSVVSITYAIMNKSPDQPQQANWAMWQAIERALEKTPETRFRSAGEFIAALKQVQKTFEPGNVVMDPMMTQQPYVYSGQVIAGPPPVYNPFGPNVQATHTPYGTPMPGQAGGGPAPYASGQPTYVPYQPTSTGQVPVYYPPPPRTPWVKPETKQAIAKFFIAVLLIGATIGFVVLVLNALTNTVQPSASQPVRESSGDIASGESTLPPAESSSVATGTDRPIEPNVARGDAPVVNPTRGPLSGESVDINGILRNADEAIDEAAVTESPTLRQQLWTRADGLYAQAINSVSDSRDQDEISDYATDKYVTTANGLIQIGERSRAREAYMRAKGFARNDPDLVREIDAAIEVLGG